LPREAGERVIVAVVVGPDPRDIIGVVPPVVDAEVPDMLGCSASDALPFVLCGVVRDRGELRGVEVLDLGPDGLEPRLRGYPETTLGLTVYLLDS
jgi:hypothetical protein